MPWKSFWFGTKYAVAFQTVYWFMAIPELLKANDPDNFVLYCVFAGISFVVTCASIAYLHKKREDELVSVQHRDIQSDS